MDQNGSQESRHPNSRKAVKTKEPTQFMFIDSSDHGTNAKPDKTVRSFVMKSARRRKPWSTRQKSPREEDDGEKRVPSPQPRAMQGDDRVDNTAVFPGSWYRLAASPTANSAQSLGSRLTSRNGSSFCSGKDDRSATRTPSSCRSVCDTPNCTGEWCSAPHAARTVSDGRDGFIVNFNASFDCLPVPMNEKMRGLLDNFVNWHSSLLVPLDRHQTSKRLITKWVADSILSGTGPPFICAILTSSALYSQATGAADSLEALRFKTDAIREIHTLFSDPDPSKRIHDNNITAVFILLCLEESQLVGRSEEDTEWSWLQRRTHLTGLKTMIDMRGGLAALRSNRCLQLFILMHSVAWAITMWERPYTTLVDITGAIQQYDLPSFRSPQPSTARVLRLFQIVKLDESLSGIVSDAVVFIGDLEYWFTEQNCPANALELQKQLCLLMYRLFDWYKQGEEDITMQSNPVNQSVCLALIIFLAISYDNSYRMVYTAACKLASALERSLLRWGKAPELLMWTLTMGALATQGKLEFIFFKRYYSVIFADQGFNEFTNAEELLDMLRKCLWLSKLDADTKRMWAKMGFCKGEGVVETVERVPTSPEGIIKDNEVIPAMTSDRFFTRRSSSR